MKIPVGILFFCCLIKLCTQIALGGQSRQNQLTFRKNALNEIFCSCGPNLPDWIGYHSTMGLQWHLLWWYQYQLQIPRRLCANTLPNLRNTHTTTYPGKYFCLCHLVLSIIDIIFLDLHYWNHPPFNLWKSTFEKDLANHKKLLWLSHKWYAFFHSSQWDSQNFGSRTKTTLFGHL